MGIFVSNLLSYYIYKFNKLNIGMTMGGKRALFEPELVGLKLHPIF